MVTVQQIKVRPPKRIRADATQIGKLYRAYNGADVCAGIALATGAGIIMLHAEEAHGGIAYQSVVNHTYRFELADDISVTLENTDV